MTSGLPMPNHISDIGRSVIECGGANTAVVRSRKERIARAQTCADNAQILIALLFQPIETAAYINDRLAACIDGAADVR